MLNTLPPELQDHIYNLVHASCLNDVMVELTHNVVHGLYYDNKEIGDDHLELHEDELTRRGMLEEAKQQWALTTQLTMFHLDMNVIYAYGESSYRGCDEWFHTLYSWSETPTLKREVLLSQHSKLNQMQVKVSERKVDPVECTCQCCRCVIGYNT